MSVFTGKVGAAGSGLLTPGRVYVELIIPDISYGSIKFKNFKLEKNIDFKFDIKKTVE